MTVSVTYGSRAAPYDAPVPGPSPDGSTGDAGAATSCPICNVTSRGRRAQSVVATPLPI